MTNDLCDNPGIIIMQDKVVRTTKVKKWISKNNPSSYEVRYLKLIPSDFKEVERELKNLENEYLGLDKVKIKPKEEQREYPYVYRVNSNTVICAYNEKDFNNLKMFLQLRYLYK